MRGVPVHDAGHDEQEQAEIEVEHRAAERVNDVGTEEGTRQGSQRKGNSGLKVDPALTDIGQRAREGIGEYHDQRCAGDLGGRVEIRPDAAIGQAQDEDRHADKPAADAYKCAKDTDTKAKQQEYDEFHKKDPFIMGNP